MLKINLALPILFFSAAAGWLHGDVQITSGDVGWHGIKFFEATSFASMQGSGLNVDGIFPPSPGLLIYSNSGNSTTFDPNTGVTGVHVNGPVLYNGSIFSFGLLSLHFTGPVVTVPRSGPYGRISAVSGVPFAMTGTLTPWCALPCQSVDVPISGFGYYSAFVDDYSPYPEQQATFQFTSFDPSKFDPVTQGTWTGSYGGDGYMIANGVSKFPNWASATVTGASTFTWAGQTSDSRALLNGEGATSRIASAYTQYPNNSFTFNVFINYGNSHQIALYLLDWEGASRSETITIRNLETNAVIDSRTYSSFHDGIYAIWNLAGNVTITVTPDLGTTPVVSGIFFGYGSTTAMPLPALASVAYAGSDTSTKGAWTGKYGANGYLIANGASKAPAYGIASVTGAMNYTWSAVTTDPRALQTGPGSSVGIASAYTQYQSTSFAINVNVTDGNLHNVSLYMLDWDGNNRSQTITIIDASTNTVLDTRVFSGFYDGLYASWAIKGNVTIKVTPVGTTSPVVSGIFFN
jgi:hypothetical protein